MTVPDHPRGQKIAVIGAGISGLSAAWLLSKAHDVTLYEATARLGGHSHTVDAPSKHGAIAVDTGFIVYNVDNYPNLTALFHHLGVATKRSNMGFAVSLDDGRMEYGGDNLATLFSQWRNLVSPRFWSMLIDLLRFYREAPSAAAGLETDLTSLGDFLDQQGYGSAFQEDHLLPQAAAIWSASARDIRDLPAAAFIRFCENHGLLRISNRPVWRTVEGGSRDYVGRLTADSSINARLGVAVTEVRRTADGVCVRDARGEERSFDQVVVATHADQALDLLQNPTSREIASLGSFNYSRNLAVLHSDVSLMPRRRTLWSAWNYMGCTTPDGDRRLCVTYWMNRLQGLPDHSPLFVTLNPARSPDSHKLIHTEMFEHPRFDAAAIRAQSGLWALQGHGGVWWCGAYFGSGFHEDGLQSGLAVAEAIGGVRRPWSVTGQSDRIQLSEPHRRALAPELTA